MNIDIRFFASLREAVGTSHERVELPDHVTTVGELQQWLAGRGEVWMQALAPDRAVRSALDHALVGPEADLHEGAEVAFFPPVTGG